MGVVCMAIGRGLFYVKSCNYIINSFKSKNWPTVSALVNENHVNAKAGEDNDLYRLNFEAIYSVAGKEYNKVNRYLGFEGHAMPRVADEYDITLWRAFLTQKS